MEIQENISDFLTERRGNKMIRKKFEQLPLLKAKDYKDGEVILKTAIIKDIREVHTKFNDEGENSTIFDIEDSDTNITYTMFINQSSMNNLIDAYGDDDSLWLNKLVSVVCNTDNYLKNKQLVVSPILSKKVKDK
jgi:hypothetical protein